MLWRVAATREPAIAEQACALARLAASLLAAARREAAALREQAAAEAAASRLAAQAEAERLLAAAVLDGREAGEASARALIGAARREAAEVVLEARRDVYDELCRRALAELSAAASTPRGKALSDHLAEAARARLREPAVLERFGPGGLGVRVRTGSRSAEIAPEGLIANAIAARADEVEGLWR